MKSQVLTYLAQLVVSLFLISPALAEIGGTAATGGEDFAKSTVGLILTKSGLPAAGCSAVLIGEHLALTAAHCLPHATDEFLTLVFALSAAAMTPDCVRTVKSYATPPEWSPDAPSGTWTADVALLYFDGSLPASYQPVEMIANASVLKPGGTVLSVGYGVTDASAMTGGKVLRSAAVAIVGKTAGQLGVIVDESHGDGPCFGDSGGPGFIHVNGELLLWGVMSTGWGSSDCSAESKFTSITAYASWISAAAAALQR